jgi:hypothetical protein
MVNRATGLALIRDLAHRRDEDELAFAQSLRVAFGDFPRAQPKRRAQSPPRTQPRHECETLTSSTPSKAARKARCAAQKPLILRDGELREDAWSVHNWMP